MTALEGESNAKASGAPSRVVRFLWWCLIIVPLPNLLFAMLVGVLSGKEQDAMAVALWSPLFLVTFVAALMVLLKAVVDNHLSVRQRLGIAGLALSMGPIYAVVVLAWFAFAIRPIASVLNLLISVSGAGAAMWFLWWIRPIAWTVEAEAWSP